MTAAQCLRCGGVTDPTHTCLREGNTVSDIELVKTCSACPEQYDAFVDGKQVGYLRLRHGTFRVDFPDVGGEMIYWATPAGDGMFEDSEREYYLGQARAAIAAKLLMEDQP